MVFEPGLIVQRAPEGHVNVGYSDNGQTVNVRVVGMGEGDWTPAREREALIKTLRLLEDAAHLIQERMNEAATGRR